MNRRVVEEIRIRGGGVRFIVGWIFIFVGFGKSAVRFLDHFFLICVSGRFFNHFNGRGSSIGEIGDDRFGVFGFVHDDSFGSFKSFGEGIIKVVDTVGSMRYGFDSRREFNSTKDVINDEGRVCVVFG